MNEVKVSYQMLVLEESSLHYNLPYKVIVTQIKTYLTTYAIPSSLPLAVISMLITLSRISLKYRRSFPWFGGSRGSNSFHMQFQMTYPRKLYTVNCNLSSRIRILSKHSYLWTRSKKWAVYQLRPYLPLLPLKVTHE